MKRKKLFKSNGLKETWAPLIMAFFLPVSGFAAMPTIKKTQNNVIVSPLVNITGTIKDSNGQPLPGASVKIKGTTTGTSTDGNGVFRLNLPTGNETIVISMMGYKTQEISMTGKTAITVTLKDEASDLDEVVVVGYGTVKKRDLTGAVASVKADDIVLTPTANAMDALQGKVSGMDIMKSSGRAGSNVKIALRGTRSIGSQSATDGSNEPLYIIDGIAGDYSRLNPNDIESIDVLKDASSTAIYGSAGSNGVVIITTKKGKAGEATISFDSFFGYNGFPKYPHGQTGDAFVNLKREAYRGANGNYPEFMSDVIGNKYMPAYEAGKWIDWVDLAIRDGLQQNYSVSVNGGTEKTKAYLSLNYNDEQGLIENDEYKKYGVRANIDHTLSKYFKVGTNLQLTYSNNNEAAQNIFGNSLSFLPLGDPFDANGNINHTPIEDVTSPLADQIKDQYVNNKLNMYFAGNAFVEVTPFKGFSYRSVLGTILGSARNGKYFGTQSIANPEAGFKAPVAVIVNDRIYNYRWENIFSYEFDFNNNHRFNLTGVTSWAKNQSEQAYAAGSGFDMDAYSFHNLQGATKATIRSSYIQNQAMSFVGRVNYNYKGKYLLSLSNRWDGVSRLSEGNKWDVFPAGAVAWRISDENFFSDIKSVSSLKLRVGYGITGNSGGVGAYGTQAGGFNAPLPVGFGENTPGPSFILNQELANNNLGWEKSYNTNIGVDAEFFKGVVNLTVDWYNTETKDMLYLRTMPGSLGGSWGAPFKIWQNIGGMNNKGLEVLINTRNIERDNFLWSTTFTFATNKEKIVSLPGNKDLISSSLFMNQPINTFFDYKYLGIWQENEAAEAAKYNSVPGDIKLATNGTFDANGKHAYGANDKMILGSGVPDWTGGLQNNFKYKNFDASIFITARWGQMIKSEMITRYNPTTSLTNSQDDIDYWTPENPGAYLPRPGIHPTTSGYIGFDALKYVDGSYFKIRNITLGYSLPQNLISKLSMQKVRFYGTAGNPFIFTKSKYLKYQDPESNGSDNFPLTKQFVFGLNVTF
jgi:TonB-linked SusC/RagA family outer membrane protein